MNKTQYSDLHKYTEAKSTWILAEERKYSDMNKTSETEQSKDNSSREVCANKNKNKESKKKKKYQKSNTNSSINKKFPRSAPTADKMVTYQLKASKTARAELQR